MAAAAEVAALAIETALVGPQSEVRTILEWIGFRTAVHRGQITEESFQSYDDILTLKEKDIYELAGSFQKRDAAERIIFGQRRIKKLKALIHWTRDFRRMSHTPDIDGSDAVAFNEELDTAARRQEVRLVQIENSDSVMKEASPGMLKSEAMWNEWEPAFENYLSSAYGVDGVPLNYVIRDDEAPDHVTLFTDFTDKCIACAPMTGPAYEADKRQVHQYVVSFTHGELSEDWIKPVKRQKNGREDMLRLRAHFAGEGNASRRIAVAERLRETLHYRNERSLAFEIFLSKTQKMFNIFEQQEEPMAEEAKVRFILKKVQHPQLANAVETMRSKLATDAPGTVTVATVSNYLASRVSELPDYIAKNRNISSVGTQGDDGEANIYKEDGSINVGYYPKWRKLSQDQKDKVIEERKRRGLDKNKNNDGKGGKGNKKQIQNLKKLLRKGKRKIASLKKKVSIKDDDGDGDGSEDSDDTSDEAGNQFGGKHAKRKAKKNKS